MDALWKLTRDCKGTFFWNRISPQIVKEVPPCHWDHSGWEYESKMWIFGGKVILQDDYSFKYCNQLHCFNPSIKSWTNPECTGSVPAPCAAHATTIVRNKVWLYGGTNLTTTSFDDLHELNMHSLSWTQIETDLPKPQLQYWFSLNAVTQNKIVLHGSCAPDSLSIRLFQFFLYKYSHISFVFLQIFLSNRFLHKCSHVSFASSQVFTNFIYFDGKIDTFQAACVHMLQFCFICM